LNPGSTDTPGVPDSTKAYKNWARFEHIDERRYGIGMRTDSRN